MIDIENLRRLDAEATPGPWETNDDEHDAPYLPVKIKAGRHRSVCTLWIDDAPVPDYNREQYSNAAIIVAMRNALPELLRKAEAFDQIVAQGGEAHGGVDVSQN